MIGQLISLTKKKLFSQLHRITKTQCITSRSRYQKIRANYFDDVEEDKLNEQYNALSNEYLGHICSGHRVLILQPFIKWGRFKKKLTTPELQMAEAEALVTTLPDWQVIDKIRAPMMTFKRRCLFGNGTLDNLKNRMLCMPNVTAIFISLEFIKKYQAKELQSFFGVPIYDRYSIIVHIFREHAKSPEAKLQVALAEVPYIYQQTCVLADENHNYNVIHHRKNLLMARKLKLAEKIKKLREHRHLIRRSRVNNKVPSVAVVGYTNAGKTSLIKALTGDENLQPRNQLFATLDTTTHAGMLPCRLEVLFIDTIGFIQDVPQRLIEPFIVTLEDALIADVIIHIYDASHLDVVAQIDHVKKTLKSLLKEPRPIIHIANKCDVAVSENIPADSLPISATKQIGIDLVRHRVEQEILAATGRAALKMRVKFGSPEEAYLYNQMTIIDTSTDNENSQFTFLHVLATNEQLFRFKRFLKDQL